MKATFSAILILSAIYGRTAVIEFDLSPPGVSRGVGLSPLNEVIPGFSGGSGNEIPPGIFFDTTTILLTLNLGYGSAAGFTDLTTPAFSWLPAWTWHDQRNHTRTVLICPRCTSSPPIHPKPVVSPAHSRSTRPRPPDLLAGLDYTLALTKIDPPVLTRTGQGEIAAVLSVLLLG